MGLFALLARFLPRWVRSEERPHFAAAPMAPRRLERRRVFDAAAAGVMLEAIPDMHLFVQTGEYLSASTQNDDQEQQVAALNGFPQATISLRDAELFEDQSTLAVISISDSSPLSHLVTIDWGDGSPLQTITAGDRQQDVLAVHRFLDDNPTATVSDSYTVKATVTNSLNESVTTSATILVKNVAPTIGSLSINSPINENATATLAGTYSDAGTLDTHQLDIDWDGNGSFDQTVTVSGGSFSISRQFVDDNPSVSSSDTSNVSVRISDDDGGQDTRSVQLTLRNVAPVLSNVTITSPIVENGTATLTGRYTDVGTRDTHVLDIDWDGNGTYDQTVAVAGGSFSIGRQFLDDNPSLTPSDTFNVNVRLRDDDGGQDTEATSLTVENADPILILNPLMSIDENGVATLTGTYSDTGAQDTHILAIDWDGNGVFDQTVAVTGGAFTITRQFLDDNPTETASDTYMVSVVLRDDDGGVDAGSRLLEVRNVDPVITLTPPAAINESEFAVLQGTITDMGSLDTFTVTVDWGDPQGVPLVEEFQFGITPIDDENVKWNPATREFSISHRYLDDNPSQTPTNNYTIVVAVTDDDTGFGVAQTSITVRNVDLTLELAADQTVDEGSKLDLTGGKLGNFRDVGTQDTHTATVDWGDGSGPQTVVVTEANGFGTLSDDHTYADNGLYTVTVTVTDDDTGGVSSTFKVTVNNVDPTLTGVSSPITVKEGQEFTLAGLQVGLEDPGFDNLLPQGGTQETLTAFSVDWGDGSLPQALSVGPESNGAVGRTTKAPFVHAAHAYADDGTYTVKVTVKDDDGLVVVRELTIIVENVDPTLALTPRVLLVTEGQELKIDDLGIFTDPGFNNFTNPNGPSTESFQYTVDWGDGTLTQNDPEPINVVDGRQGVLTQGSLRGTHTYVDNDADNLYTITVTVFDDDGGSDTEQIQVRVLNVNPSFLDLDSSSPNVIIATDVSTRGETTLTLQFTNPGDEDFYLPPPGQPDVFAFEILVDWGDKAGVTNFVVAGRMNEIPTGPITFTHTYAGPPDPLHPSDDIKISVKIRDDDFRTATPLGAIGESVVATVEISNPGIGGEPFRIDTTPQVPQLTFPVRVEAVFLPDTTGSNVVVQQDVRLGASSGETVATTDRYIELRVIDAEGKEGPGYRLRPDVLKDLPGLFRSLPDNHYVVYVVNMETNSRRLVIEVYVRNGKLIDPGDDSEGTRDRPPTDEQTSQAQTTLPVGELPAEQATTSNQLGPNKPTAALVPRPDDSVGLSEAVPAGVRYRRCSRWAALAVGLAASSSSQSWADRVDQAVAQATAQQWRKLQGHNPPKPKNQ